MFSLQESKKKDAKAPPSAKELFRAAMVHSPAFLFAS
jgi:hypothetical protein